MPLFSIIVPTFNRAALLARTLDSVFAQRYTEYEINVVDDGSTDETTDYLRSLGKRVNVFRQSNRGPGAARNLGAQHAKGKYLAFLDSDDLWLPWTLTTFHRLIQDHEPSILCGAAREFRDDVPHIDEEHLVSECFRDYFETSNSPSFVGSGTLVVKTAVFARFNGFDETILVAEDHDFYLRAGNAPGFVRVRSPVTLAYRRHGGNISTMPQALLAGASQLLSREFEGLYPGGKARQIARWRLLSRIVRPIVFSSLAAGYVREAWCLYRKSFRMNVRLARIRFLAGFVLYGTLALASRRWNAIIRTGNSM